MLSSYWHHCPPRHKCLKRRNRNSLRCTSEISL